SFDRVRFEGVECDLLALALSRRFLLPGVFQSFVRYGPSHYRQIRIVVAALEGDQVEVRFHEAWNTGDADEVVVEFTRINGRSDDPRGAIAEAATRVRLGGVTWLRPDGDHWIVDGDVLRHMTEDLASLQWLA